MHILIIHQGALGDFILSLPAIGAFRHAYPGSTIEIWGYTAILRLVEGRFYADAIASINRPGMSNLYSESASAPDALLNKAREKTRGYPRALEALYAILSVDRYTTLEELLEISLPRAS